MNKENCALKLVDEIILFISLLFVMNLFYVCCHFVVDIIILIIIIIIKIH